ncbi:MAG TPA: allophanate hydrolase, partial [Acidimicrobiaceae bacterium]|nr:allophanate hydrolase [Acidimicrobiaceae bacterium]
GPHLDRFGSTALQLLVATRWTVENNSRVGVRLSGGNVEVADGSASAASEPMVVGALQVPPSGSPIILGRDHPVTGGYPVIAVVDDASMSQALGAAIGTTLSFRLS